MTRKRTLALVVVAITTITLTAFAGAATATPGNGNGNADRTNSDDGHQAGPPDDLPGPVPDFVAEIHAQIRAFLDGGLDNLGAAVSDIAGSNADNSSDSGEADSDGA